MGKRYLLLSISALCLLSACGSSTPSQGDAASEAASTPSSITAPEAPPEASSAASGETEALAETSQAPSSEGSVETPQANALSNHTAALPDTIVVPGERVGPVTMETTRADLAELFGEAALEDTEIPVGEGFTEPGTTINAGTEQAFSIIWTDETRTQPATAKDFGSAWQTPEGLQLGTSFAELESTLGSFDLFGFGWDYEGTVLLEGSNLENYDGLLILRARPELETTKQFPDEYAAVLGDKQLSSDDPNLDPLNLSVYEMIVYLTPLIP